MHSNSPHGGNVLNTVILLRNGLPQLLVFFLQVLVSDGRGRRRALCQLAPKFLAQHGRYDNRRLCMVKRSNADKFGQAPPL